MIVKLERTQSNAQQNKDKHRTPTTNGKHTKQQQQQNHRLRRDNSLGHGDGGRLKCILLVPNLCPRFCCCKNTKLFSSHGSFLTNTVYHQSKACVKLPLSKTINWFSIKTKYRLMQVKSIAECSEGSILQHFRPSLSYHLSLRSLFCLFLSGRFTPVLYRFYCMVMALFFVSGTKILLEKVQCNLRPSILGQRCNYSWQHYLVLLLRGSTQEITLNTQLSFEYISKILHQSCKVECVYLPCFGSKTNPQLVFFLMMIDLIISQSTIFQLGRDGSSWVEPVLCKD